MKKLSLFFILIFVGCTTAPTSDHQTQLEKKKDQTSSNLSNVKVGLDVLLDDRLQLIQNKSIGLVTNQTGVDGNGTPNYKRFMALDDVTLKIIFSPI